MEWVWEGRGGPVEVINNGSGVLVLCFFFVWDIEMGYLRARSRGGKQYHIEFEFLSFFLVQYLLRKATWNPGCRVDFMCLVIDPTASRTSTPTQSTDDH